MNADKTLRWRDLSGRRHFICRVKRLAFWNSFCICVYPRPSAVELVFLGSCYFRRMGSESMRGVENKNPPLRSGGSFKFDEVFIVSLKPIRCGGAC